MPRSSSFIICKSVLLLCIGVFRFAGLMAGGMVADSGRSISISGYMDMYYCYDFGQPSDHLRPPFFYSYNRHDEVNLNLGFVKAAFKSNAVRWNAAVMGGTYSQYNLSAEPVLLRSILEANAGFKMSRAHNLWLDAGVMPSHIGFESAIGKDCWNLSRSILADNSPYFVTGAKMSYTSRSEKWNAAALVMNGWQRIHWNPAHSLPSFGTQLNYKPDSCRQWNWSTFIGNMKGGGGYRHLRVFNNFYGQFQLTGRWAATAGFDIGLQQKRDSAGLFKGWSHWMSPVLILRYTLSKRFAIAGRAEYYADKDRVMIPGSTNFGFSTLGGSANVDIKLRENVLWRLEGRMLVSKDNEFFKKGKPANISNCIATSVSVAF